MPSELLRRMRELTEDVPADSAIIKQLFFSRLPSQVKAILVPMVEKSSVDVIASSADKVMEFTITASIPQPKAEVSTLLGTQAAGNTSQVATQVAILDAVERLTQEIQKLAVVRSHLPRRQYKRCSPSPHPRCHSNKPGLCFYHSRFGAEARRCAKGPVLKPGKLKSGELSTAHSPQDLCNNRTYFIMDFRPQAHCLVDTGAACSIWLLKLLTEKLPVSPITLQAVNHSPIPMYGRISRSLDLELRRDFTWIFTVADLPYPILGSDFLHHFNLLVDMRKRRLSVTGFKANTSPISPVSFIAATDNLYQILLCSYPELTNLNFVVKKSTHSTTHHIETTGAPVFSHPHRLPADILKTAKAEFNHMLQLGIIRPSSSSWASPLHISFRESMPPPRDLVTPWPINGQSTLIPSSFQELFFLVPFG